MTDTPQPPIEGALPRTAVDGLRFLNRWSIQRKLGFGFGMLLLGTVIVVLTGLMGLFLTQRSYETAIEKGVAIERQAALIRTYFLEARRSEKDFLLRWQTMGFETARKAYVEKNQGWVADLQQATDELGTAIASSELANDQALGVAVVDLRRKIGIYQKEFLVVVGLLEQRGFFDDGLEGQVRTRANLVEQGLVDVGGQETPLMTLLQMRRREKDYLLRRDLAYVEEVRGYGAQLKEQLNATPLSAQQRAVDDYLAAFGTLVALDVQELKHIQALRTAAHAVEPLIRLISAAGLASAQSDVAHAMETSDQTFASVALLLALVLVLSALASYMLSRRITGPVKLLTTAARQLGTGDLTAQAQVQTSDEIGVLARTFNHMAGQLRGLLDSLRDRNKELQREKQRVDKLLHGVIPIGVDLTAEPDYSRLLELILLEARSFCNADAGMLYLLIEGDQLDCVIVRNKTLDLAMGGTSGLPVTLPSLPLRDPQTGKPNDRHLAVASTLNGRTINIANVEHHDDLDLADITVVGGDGSYAAESVLTVPLMGKDEGVIGVLVLINALDPEAGVVVPFDDDLLPMVESLSALASAALEVYAREQRLREQIIELRIEIDEAKTQSQVAEIIGTEYFQNLREKARKIRAR